MKRERGDTVPPLVGVAEVAELLGVSKQRVSQLDRQNLRFPPPEFRLRGGPVWTRSSIELFVQIWPRKPGRPAGKADT